MHTLSLMQFILGYAIPPDISLLEKVAADGVQQLHMIVILMDADLLSIRCRNIAEIALGF